MQCNVEVEVSSVSEAGDLRKCWNAFEELLECWSFEVLNHIVLNFFSKLITFPSHLIYGCGWRVQGVCVVVQCLFMTREKYVQFSFHLALLSCLPILLLLQLDEMCNHIITLLCVHFLNN